MTPIVVEIINWKTKILWGVVAALVHPLIYLGFDFFQGKPVGKNLIVYAALFAFYVALELFVALGIVLRGTPHKLLADEQGLFIKAFWKSKRLAWSQIATLQKSQDLDGETLKNRLILRDAGGTVLAQLWRDLQETPALGAQWEQLEGFITSRLGTRAFTLAPLNAAPTRTSFAHKTNNKPIGVVGLLFLLPCAFFSWNHPTGGPWVGAIFLFFAFLCVFLLLSDSRAEVDERGVRSFGLWQKGELRWDEIRRAEMMSGGGVICFYGEDETQAVSINGPTGWKESGELMLFLQSQFKRFGIEWNGNKAWNWREMVRFSNKIN